MKATVLQHTFEADQPVDSDQWDLFLEWSPEAYESITVRYDGPWLSHHDGTQWITDQHQQEPLDVEEGICQMNTLVPQRGKTVTVDVVTKPGHSVMFRRIWIRHTAPGAAAEWLSEDQVTP